MAPASRPQNPREPQSPFLRIRPPAARRIRKPVLWIAGAAALALVASALVGKNGLRTYLDLRAERIQLANEVEVLAEHRAELDAGLAALDENSGNSEALERIARERYRMRRPGETVIEVVGEDELPTAPRKSTAEN